VAFAAMAAISVHRFWSSSTSFCESKYLPPASLESYTRVMMQTIDFSSLKMGDF
jgi:hypothetical protein